MTPDLTSRSGLRHRHKPVHTKSVHLICRQAKATHTDPKLPQPSEPPRRADVALLPSVFKTTLQKGRTRN